jgi:riboflavin kinase / FMN adenylyltransferase
MKIIHAAKDLKPGRRKVCLAIGFFDGVHLGHQQIIRQTIADARQHNAVAVVLTFDRHPNTVVAPARVPPLIYSLRQKQRMIAPLKADVLLVLHFDWALSRQSGESFVRNLVADLGRVRSICVGADFVFGHKRSGDVAMLKRLGAELGFTVHGLAAVSLDGKVVSSTRIRQAIRTGQLDAASQMLGRPYSISGEVVRGDGVGRKLGVPTANLEIADRVLPPNGVYAVRATMQRKSQPAVLNIGLRPTLGRVQPALRVEAHLLDFEGRLYGKEMELTFVKRLRGEKRFPSLGALQRQIVRDIAAARECF